jgi:peptidoglycan LD-endopeptidase LytH
VLQKSTIPAARWTSALVVLLLLFMGPAARGQQSLDDLQDRLDELQGELDATTERLEDLRTEQDVVHQRINEIELEIDRIENRSDGLVERAEERADFLYRQGTAGMLEALVSAEDFGDLMVRADLAARVSDQNNEVFYRLARDEEQLTALDEELVDRQDALENTTADLESTSEELQAKFEEVGDEYDELKKELAQARREEAAEEAAITGGGGGGGSPPTGPPPTARNGMFCPVNGPVSFIDSWGAPRVGHTHVGVDMMADYGTPLVAIVSGTVSSGYSSTGGNSIYLSGDDGNSYWYLHNQVNQVTGGHVQAGQQIATVGDTGNATGIPHVHFEYHPGGGGPVNPYPLVASIC